MLKINNGNKYIRLKKHKLSVVDKKNNTSNFHN